jgi:glutathione S-transferase
MIKLYGHPMSTCTRKVLTTLAETNTQYDLVVIDFAKGEHKQQPHVSRQPFGQVPAIEDDGFAMYESRAIARYINEKVGGNLSPKDVAGRAKMEQWISIEAQDFSPHVMKFVFQHIFKRPQAEDVLQNAQKAVDLALDVSDAHLGKQPYFAGEQFSLADICFMPYVEYALKTPLKDSLTKRSNFSAWWKKVSERPSWKKVTSPTA